MFGYLWDSGIVLADLMLDQPIEGLRFLEVGCGLALGSIVLSLRGADITATDQHPEASSFLEANVALNGGPPIPFRRAGWTEMHGGGGTFDVIIGSDVLYEQQHPEALSGLVARHAAPSAQVIIVDPGRRHIGSFVRLMTEYGWAADRSVAPSTAPLEGRSTGHLLRFER
ncbi:MAG: methyltransferase domain-containing protein [Myxococcota bacterium]